MLTFVKFNLIALLAYCLLTVSSASHDRLALVKRGYLNNAPGSGFPVPTSPHEVHGGSPASPRAVTDDRSMGSSTSYRYGHNTGRFVTNPVFAVGGKAVHSIGKLANKMTGNRVSGQTKAKFGETTSSLANDIVSSSSRLQRFRQGYINGKNDKMSQYRAKWHSQGLVDMTEIDKYAERLQSRPQS